MTINKKNGDQYKPDSLSTVQRGIQKHLDIFKMNVNVFADDSIEKRRKVSVARGK